MACYHATALGLTFFGSSPMIFRQGDQIMQHLRSNVILADKVIIHSQRQTLHSLQQNF